MKKVLFYSLLFIAQNIFGQTPGAPTISLSKSSVCVNEVVTLTASGCVSPNYVYWSNGATGLTTTFSDFSGGINYLSARCHQSSTVYSAYTQSPSITVVSNPNSPFLQSNIDVYGQSAVYSYSGDPVTLTATSCVSPNVVEWDNSLGTGLTKTVNPTITTTYISKCKNPTGCLSNGTSKTITVRNIKVTSPTPTTSCSDATLAVSFINTAVVTGSPYTVKFKKFIDTFGGCNEGITDLVTQTTTSNSLNITLPSALTPTGQNGFCYSPFSGNIPIFVSYYIEVSNGAEVSLKYPVAIGTCTTIQNISIPNNCFSLASTTVNANFNLLGVNSGNVLTAELSNLGGSTFPSTPIVLGTLTSSSATSMALNIPANTPAGTYKIKIKTSNPVGEGLGNFIITPPATTVPTLTKTPNTAVVAAGTNITLTGSGCEANANIVWTDNNSAPATRIVNPTTNTTYTAKCVNSCGESGTSTINVNILAAPTIAGPNMVCLGSSITLVPSGCPANSLIRWYKNAETSYFTYTVDNESIIVSPLSNTSYFARCYASSVESLNSNSLTVTVNSLPPTATAASGVLNTINPLNATLTATCASGTLTWTSKVVSNYNSSPYAYTETNLGTGSPFNTNLSHTGENYIAKCENASTSCASSVKAIIKNTLAGVAISAYNGDYAIGNFSGTANTFIYGDQTIEFHPINQDAGTYFFQKGVMEGSYNSNATAFVSTIERKGNNWEIWDYEGKPAGYLNSSVRKYHTKEKYATQLPPCSAIWINDANSSEATYTISGFCDNAAPMPPCATIAIATTPALVLGTTSTLTVSGCSSPNTISWSGGVSGNTASVNVTPTGPIVYTVTCSGTGCTSSQASNNTLLAVANITLSGVATPNNSTTYNLGCHNFTAYYPGGSSNVSICPSSPDAGTNYYYNGSVQSGQYTGPSSTQFIVRKNNYWEVQYFSNSTLAQTKYKTKYKYNGSQPPCTAVWINLDDNSEITLTIGGACQTETSCQVMTLSSSVASPLPANTEITITAIGCDSPNIVTWNTGATGSALVVTPSANTTYLASCFGATCFSSLSSISVTMQCPIVLNLASINPSTPSDDQTSGTITKQASSNTGGKITATNKITGTANVTYQAKIIELNEGFKADNGTVFKAEVGGCN